MTSKLSPIRKSHIRNDTSNAKPRTEKRSSSRPLSRGKKEKLRFGNYILGATLGEGEFGKVKLGWSTASPTASLDSNSKQIAIKLIRRDYVKKGSDKEIKIYREINALKLLTHPNIVRLEEVLQNSKYIGIVLEFASGGEFYKYLQRKRRLKEPHACQLFAQLISGVTYMHSKGLVHRDLKLENLLLDKNENLIITDFGFVNEFFGSNELMKRSCGSPCYAAPELVLSTEPYRARKVDIWSCGIILYAMLAGYLPWDDDSQNPNGDDIGKLYQYITKTALKFPAYISPLARDLIRKILTANPSRRISISYICKHDWLKPHASFLAVEPREWDRMVKKKSNASRDTSSSEMKSSSLRLHSKSYRHNTIILEPTMEHSPSPPLETQSYVLKNIRASDFGNTSSSMNHESTSPATKALHNVIPSSTDSLNYLTATRKRNTSVHIPENADIHPYINTDVKHSTPTISHTPVENVTVQDVNPSIDPIFHKRQQRPVTFMTSHNAYLSNGITSPVSNISEVTNPKPKEAVSVSCNDTTEISSHRSAINSRILEDGEKENLVSEKQISIPEVTLNSVKDVEKRNNSNIEKEKLVVLLRNRKISTQLSDGDPKRESTSKRFSFFSLISKNTTSDSTGNTRNPSYRSASRQTNATEVSSQPLKGNPRRISHKSSMSNLANFNSQNTTSLRASKFRNNRASVMVSSLENPNPRVPIEKADTETSLSSKVINFFKRRSMRI
ncbi:putative serine/threonine protein kinase KIN4 NDAI_0E01290 [Naumovozyma dairenensis CBS 421]|uniref:non-specific serine/threonine protein kinase n=1 Tax=Naumovozyma dairenensis (strain ATCC 10597 / BCRC 20456 / CBS 421 / NBRC 0211 / NRRL Y-12639) TaxID=1071378 RepID=G0WB25_NAUDC|nr:hypothetical protein NDAI_0E01290 [Naumovozyma dairenensis CBS 421]CCD24945.1 hypothetical protein NDAI_0E01290 [Naumovozyma dairenensis CBS 421]